MQHYNLRLFLGAESRIGESKLTSQEEDPCQKGEKNEKEKASVIIK